MDPLVARATDSYIDDIIVDESVVSAESVRAHLTAYGLTVKTPVPLCDARVLGLMVQRDEAGVYKWRRDNVLPTVKQCLTKRELFSLCGKLLDIIQ